jgi:hypothetical protein
MTDIKVNPGLDHPDDEDLLSGTPVSETWAPSFYKKQILRFAQDDNHFFWMAIIPSE